MPAQENANIYIEQLVTDKNSKEIWECFLNSQEFRSLFVEYPENFVENSTSQLIWKKFIFLNVHGTYIVESYKENLHLLLKITAKDFSSVLLITTSDGDDGVTLRIDHRSFYGKNSQSFRQLFLSRWKKFTKSLIPKKQ